MKKEEINYSHQSKQYKKNIEPLSTTFSFEFYSFLKRFPFDFYSRDILRQIMRSSTAVGANVTEAITCQSTKEYSHKLAIALKEARETMYWIKFLIDLFPSKATDIKRFTVRLNEIIAILYSTVKKLRERQI